ncbi:MAG: lysylphosphatidylglycerol synthase transmembrane domain-containing protein [Hyphomicrobium sp.]|jgi:uncharacterized protein (TIRG00374 family)
MHPKTTLRLGALVAVAYLTALAVVDSGRNVFARVADVAGVMPILMIASLGAYGFRFLRWRMLLASIGHPTPLGRGFLAYIAGFAFTASPGKAGELLRLRYFGQMGVPHAHGVACFVFERLLDLIVLLMLAGPIAANAPGFGVAMAFVAVVVAAIVLVAIAATPRKWLQHRLRTSGYRRSARWSRVLLLGISATYQFLPIRRLVPAVLLGLAAWSIQGLGYAAALTWLGISLPWPVLWAVPPAATLIGAASMIPGGIGTTEAATVLLLTHFGADFDRAVLAAIALRLGSMWFAVLVGFFSMAYLEHSGGDVAESSR